MQKKSTHEDKKENKIKNIMRWRTPKPTRLLRRCTEMFSKQVNGYQEKVSSFTEILLTMPLSNGEGYGMKRAIIPVDSETLIKGLAQIESLHEAMVPAINKRLDTIETAQKEHDAWQKSWQKRFGKWYVVYWLGFLAGAWSLVDFWLRVWPFVGKLFK